MRRTTARIVLSSLLCACGGGDFEAAAEVEDARSTSTDSPTLGAEPSPEAGSGAPDAANESLQNEATIDAAPAQNDRADSEEADTAADSPFDPGSDATPEMASDGSFDARPERASDGASGATCDAPMVFYRDRDGDQFGVTSESVTACSAPRTDDDVDVWVTQPGDCRDDLPNVKPFKAGSPDPPKYSGSGYSDPVRPLGISFDFDCNGVETDDPSNMYPPGPPTCPLLAATGCTGSGYALAVPARNGPGINGYCGSTTLTICTAMGLNCKLQEIPTSPYRCR